MGVDERATRSDPIDDFGVSSVQPSQNDQHIYVLSADSVSSQTTVRR
jgi:hypothetical protein